MDPAPALEGLTPDFLAARVDRLLDIILPGAESYFAEGGTPYTQNHPSLKKGEMLARYYDYQPCTISALAVLAERGEDRALAVVRRIFGNARDWLDGGREREDGSTTFRRSQLHMVLAYERLRGRVDASESSAWRDLLLRTGTDLFDHFNAFKEKRPTLDNRGFGTGINHVAIGAESMWKSGRVLDVPEWCDAAAGFIDRLIAYGHPDGYFEENTNDAREGGPSILYTPLTAGSAFLVQRWRGAVDHDRFATIGAFYRRFVDTHLRPMPFADERANPHGVGPYGLALHAITPEGRGFLRLLLDSVEMTDHVSGDIYLQHCSRAVYEMMSMDTGDGAVPEPFHDSHFRQALPFGVVRKRPWTAGLSALKALNREISARSDYAIDRQSLVALSHADAGVILEGVKSKRDPAWSTIRRGDDAYPVRTGDLTVHSDGGTARAIFDTFDVTLTWALDATARLTLATDVPDELLAQFPLEILPGDTFHANDTPLTFSPDAPLSREAVTRISTETWSLTLDTPARLTGPISPHNPYTAGNVTAATHARPLLVLPWRTQTTLTFHPAP